VNASDDDRIAYLAGDAVESLNAEERAELDELREQLGEFSTWVEPDPALEGRIVAAIAEASARPGAATAHPADSSAPPAGAEPAGAEPAGAEPAGAEPAGAESAQPGPAQPGPAQPGPAPPLPAGAGPAAAGPTQPAQPKPVEPAKPTRAPRRRLSLGGVFRRPAFAFGGLATAVAVVAIAVVIVTSNNNNGPKPLHFAMIVTGTRLAPRAKGSASLKKTGSGWRIELSATGLPHIENGRFYQAWLKNAQGILVPIGTFNDPQHVTLWSGVPVTKFRTLTVTIQLANGNPASSGRRVLVGRITPSG
jgi:hypothetical protein